MDTQEKMMRDEEEVHPLTGGVRDLAHDVLSLAELQAQLLAVDLREGCSTLNRPIWLMVGAPIVGIAGLIHLLGGVSGLIARTWTLDPAVTQTVLATVVLIGAAVMGWLGWKSLKPCGKILDRSRTELSENVAWIKAVLLSKPRHTGRPGYYSDIGHRRY